MCATPKMWRISNSVNNLADLASYLTSDYLRQFVRILLGFFKKRLKIVHFPESRINSSIICDIIAKVGQR